MPGKSSRKFVWLVAKLQKAPMLKMKNRLIERHEEETTFFSPDHPVWEDSEQIVSIGWKIHCFDELHRKKVGEVFQP
jgi:thiamine kinase-like enzyme